MHYQWIERKAGENIWVYFLNVNQKRTIGNIINNLKHKIVCNSFVDDRSLMRNIKNCECLFGLEMWFNLICRESDKIYYP